jgi:hypothetical protein
VEYFPQGFTLRRTMPVLIHPMLQCYLNPAAHPASKLPLWSAKAAILPAAFAISARS